MVENEDVSKLAADGLLALTRTLNHMRLLASPSNWCDQRRALIYELADAMHNVPHALEDIASDEGSQKWAVKELKQIPKRLETLFEKYQDLP